MTGNGKAIAFISLGLTAATLGFLSFSGILTPHPTLSGDRRINLTNPVIASPGEKIQLTLNGNTIADLTSAAISVDIGNRDAISAVLKLPGNLQAVLIDHERSLAYLANSFTGLQIIDISEPNRLNLIGAIEVRGRVWDIVRRGTTLYLAAAQGGLQVIDISNPAAPAHVAELTIPDVSFLKIALHKNTLYASTGWKGLQLVDITSPSAPRHLGTLHQNDGVWGVSVGATDLYLSAGKDTIEVLNLSDPERPIPTGQLTIPGRCWEMRAAGGYLYLPTRKAGLIIADVSDRRNPLEIARIDQGVDVETISIRGGKAYLTNRRGEFYIYDLSNPAEPKQLKRADLPFNVRNIDIAKNSIYVAAGVEGLIKLDLTALPEKPLVASLRLSSDLKQVIEDSEYFYLATKEHGLFIARKDDRGALPTIISSLPGPNRFRAMVKSGDYLYLISSIEGLTVVDISDRKHPVNVSSLNDPKDLQDLTFRDQHLYIASGTGKLLAVNIADPVDPVIVGHLKVPEPWRIALAGNRVYVSSSKSGLHVIDISTPSAPVEISRCPLPWPLQELARSHRLVVSGETAYLAAGEAKLILFNIADENNPVIENIIEVDDEVISVSVKEENIYATSRLGKLTWLQREKNGVIKYRARIDTLGTTHDLIDRQDFFLLANGVKGLTLLPKPHLINLADGSIVDKRSRISSQITLQIPPLKQVGTYNLDLYSGNQLQEFVGAVKITDN
ncbi:MAG: hypothetical protein C0623_05800 [Desulfuromonas sp.]|nr:MAG: hypothetical protein C0623_05800 [Desulfuromonas sp.]